MNSEIIQSLIPIVTAVLSVLGSICACITTISKVTGKLNENGEFKSTVSNLVKKTSELVKENKELRETNEKLLLELRGVISNEKRKK